jgi:hypothetical protein
MTSITSSQASQSGLPVITSSNLREQHHQTQHLSHPLVAQPAIRTNSPRGHSPTRERDSYR